MNWYKLAQAEEETEEIDGIVFEPKWTPVDSSWMEAISYAPSAQKLDIKVKPKDKGEESKIYTLNGVSQEEYDGFRDAPSKGIYFNRILRPKFVGK